MILNNLVLPIVYGSVSLLFIHSIFLIFYVHPCVVLVVSNFEFIKVGEFYYKKFNKNTKRNLILNFIGQQQIYEGKMSAVVL